jgi:branched-chain amino acid aminotransferase
MNTHVSVKQADAHMLIPAYPIYEGWSPQMSWAQTAMGHWQPQQLLDCNAMHFHPGAMALQFGASVFEGNKAYRHHDAQVHLFRLDEHYDRFKSSADRLCLSCPSRELFIHSIEQAAAHADNWGHPFSSEWLYIRPVLVGLDDHILPVISQEYAFYVLVAPIRTFNPPKLTLSVIRHQHRATPGGLGAAKTAANYAHQFQATQQEKSKGSDAVLWLSPLDGCTIEEASTMNIFFHMNDGSVITPQLKDTILAGITRRSVIELLADRGVAVQERDVSIHQIIDAAMSGLLKEAFVTSTALGVRTVDEMRLEQRKLETSRDCQLSSSLAQELEQVFAGYASKRKDWIRPLALRTK